MSATHQIFPFQSEFRTMEYTEWLQIPIPDDLHTGRHPSLNELHNTISKMQCTVEYENKSRISPLTIHDDNGRWMRLQTINFPRDEDQLESFTASGSRDFLVEILEKLPKSCGSFLILTDGEYPEFVSAKG